MSCIVYFALYSMLMGLSYTEKQYELHMLIAKPHFFFFFWYLPYEQTTLFVLYSTLTLLASILF